MNDATEIYIMGHSYADMDAVGAASGVYCAARKKGKRAQIVVDEDKNASEAILAKLKALPEYEGVFTSGQEAFLLRCQGLCTGCCLVPTAHLLTDTHFTY